MKRIHTQAKKARRISGYASGEGRYSGLGSERKTKRLHLQAKKVKPRGYQIERIQRIFLKKDRFGTPLFRVIHHPRYAASGAAVVIPAES